MDRLGPPTLMRLTIFLADPLWLTVLTVLGAGFQTTGGSGFQVSVTGGLGVKVTWGTGFP